MKIWKNFKTLIDARPSLSRRKCWSTCFDCQKEWSETKTEYVHMTTNKEGDTRFICTDCLIIREEKKDT